MDMIDDSYVEVAREGSSEDDAPFLGPKMAYADYLREELAATPKDSYLRLKLEALAVGPEPLVYLRRVRRDGSCFLRAFLYRFIESCVLDRDVGALHSFIDRLQSIASRLPALLGESMYIDDFFDTTYDLIHEMIAAMENPEGPNLHAALEALCTSSVIQHATYSLRLAIACALLERSDEYLPFILSSASGGDMRSFVDSEVLPAAAYTDDVHIHALTAATGISVSILSCDDTPGNAATVLHLNPPADSFSLSRSIDGVSRTGAIPFGILLLFRPSHYDLVYTASMLRDTGSPTAPATNL